MDQINYDELSFDDEDELKFPRDEVQDFDRVVERAISRRGFLGGVLAFGSGAAVMGTGLLNGTSAMAQQASRFAFEQLAPQTDGTVHVPAGYKWDVLVRWGDALFSDAPAFDPATGIPTEGSDRVFGENTDGMELFHKGDTELLVVNSEYVNGGINLPAEQEGQPVSADDVIRLQNFQGVTVMEVAEGDDGWQVVVDSPYNRRIHHRTPMMIDGPAAGHDLLKTAADPTGTQSLGTFNNCGSGRTPWGTYLTCEENFNGYFGTTAELSLDEVHANGFKRYGVSTEVDPGRYNYHGFDARFDLSKNPNEPHRAGYVVEIDPWNPDATPVKHTALGRFKHENAAYALAPDGRVVVYMGDDERGEYMYKWVSRDVYVPGGDTSTLLSEGQLHVAKFNDDGTGIWLALTPEDTGMSEAEIAIFTRMAGTAVSATTMDRPEWIAVNPTAIEGYCCLTNNSRRGATDDAGAIRTNAAGEPMTVNAPNPREVNNYGQIVRWRPHGDDHAASTFDWDLYVMAGNPTVHTEGPYAGTANINAGNMFNSPDGMMFDTTGMMWIQTDGDDDNEGDFAGMGNNQMLVGDPVTGEIRRFLTGPNGSEVTGLTWSADKRSMFVGIQHPGGNFPDGEGSLPRSAIVVVKRDDGALVG
ncbi:transcriptional initiation protein Tat [Loktanella sp. 3ANDIMAR09]|uniref:PhoX family protein n=1 Tax=Loktanella sp. 3ANDIMAR09 TaxID=1225657 RepID=UPI0006F29A97|nr:PhoX family phosphatase [Loktanella sp. 3ANDIMAR09]KQI68251.1 transcriptional initiation protein Tat [Loktanella sp. 3ANDIMAR09]